MGKHEKNSHKTPSEKVVLATAVIGLIKVIFELIKELLE